MRALLHRLSGLVLALATVPATASDEGGSPAQALIQPHIGTIFWTLVVFGLMLFILGRFAWKPLLSALNAREKSIRDNIDRASSDRDEAQRLLDEQRELLAEARRERAAAVDLGRTDAEQLKAEMLQEAQAQREQLLEQTQAQVDAGLRQARSELRGYAADMVVQATQKLLAKNLDDATQRRLVEDYLSDLESRGEPGDSLPS
jgi:F-type H+-transporting ATPase subunit b